MSSVYKPTGRNTWMIKYQREGKWVIESTGLYERDDAAEYLRAREKEFPRQRHAGPRIAAARRLETLKTRRRHRFNANTTIRLGVLREAMNELFERDGIRPSEQIRRALISFLGMQKIAIPQEGRIRG
jgi:hypothetical protein